MADFWPLFLFNRTARFPLVGNRAVDIYQIYENYLTYELQTLPSV